MPTRHRLRGMLALATSQLRGHRTATVLAVGGVAVAVLLVVLLGGVGYGAATSGGDAVSWFERDLWVTGGGAQLRPGSVEGVANPIHDAHELGRELEARPGVEHAQPFAFQTVYLGTDPDDLETVVGVGVGGDAGRLRIASRFTRRDRHYANGTYEGPMTRRVVVDERTAARYGLDVGDTVHIGGTVTAAREQTFTVVGTPRDLSNLLGAPTVGMHLSELQEVTGTTGTDPAALLTLTLAPGARPAAVERAIERRPEGLDVRTGREQFRATVASRAPTIGSLVALVALSVVAGVALVVNVLAHVVARQRRHLAALNATGVSAATLTGVVALQGGLLGLAGGVVALLAVGPAAAGLNHAVERLTGFPGLVVLPPWLAAGGLVLAVGLGVLGAAVAGRRVARLDPIATLER
ncbi:ABC transporter permease [Halorarius halobius]|uniref:ABC transporter permease n=1 Tax=Halorarius halobius TaxID=2962671 RepID=UPI0020CE805E|nr:ABC transporter permease [Halorarius halobius]